jgi:hypothetical protein
MGYQRKSLGHSSDLKELAKNLDLELEKIESALVQANQVRSLNVEPSKPREGMQAIADGSDWDPGDGQGLYTFINGAWAKSQSGDYQGSDDNLEDISALTDPGADSGLFWDESASLIDWFTATLGLEFVDKTLRLTANQRTQAISFFISGGGGPIQTGIKGTLLIPFDCTIVSAVALGDQAGAIVVDIWKDSYANYPPDNSDSITASAPVTISASGVKSIDSTLTGWDKDIEDGDCLIYNVDSVTSLTWCLITLVVLKS